MEGLHCLKFLLEQGNLLCKIDLKEVYFSVPLNKNSQKFVRFQWSGNLYQFLCLCFGLGPAPGILTKLLKVPIVLLRRVNIRIIIYLDDMLLMGRTLREILMARGTLIFLLQHLGFVVNLKKSVLHPVKQIDFLGLVIDTEKMTLALSEKKIKEPKTQPNTSQPKTSILHLTKLIGLLSSIVQAILPARIQFRYIKQEQILALQKMGSDSVHVTLGNLAIEELLWWMENLKLCNGRKIQQ